MKILITGGAGFIGCNTALRFAGRGDSVVIVDNLSRRGTQANLDWLKAQAPIHFEHCDIRDSEALNQVFSRTEPEAVIHLAGQVAVTTSVKNPREDFEMNALGTFNVLEAARANGKPFVLYASTNKVYGGMEHLVTELGPGLTDDEQDGRYRYRDLPEGISENEHLDFHSPYGCSKGAGDQYVRDYGRIYDMRTVVFRQSCIYGQRQFGIEDQGWVAWFVISTVFGRAINIYGDGKQVRDLLNVADLIRAYELAIDNRDQLKGRVFNIGGGTRFSLSLLGLVHRLERIRRRSVPLRFGDARPGDQPVYISDISRARHDLGWTPRIDPETGVSLLYEWVSTNQPLLAEQLGELLA